MRLEFYTKTWTCPSCGRGPHLVPGPLGGVSTCTACGSPFTEDVPAQRGSKVTEDQVRAWWAGKGFFCGYCGTWNQNNKIQGPYEGSGEQYVEPNVCSRCGAEAANGIFRPSTASNELAALLIRMGIDVREVAPKHWHEMQDTSGEEIRGDNSGYSLRENADEKPQADPVVFAVLIPSRPSETISESPTWVERATTALSAIPLRKAAAVAGSGLLITLFVLFLMWVFTPHAEQLKVAGYEYSLHAGYSYDDQEFGECYLDDPGCPDSRMTPIATREDWIEPDGYDVVATIETTRIVENEYTDYVYSGNEVECGTDDLGGIEVVAYCTETPDEIKIVETSVSYDYEEIKATYTPYPRTVLEYEVDVVRYDQTSVGSNGQIARQVPTQQLVYPDIPLLTTPEPYRNYGTFVVIFENEEGKIRRYTVNVDEWYQFVIGQIFPNAQVDNAGIIHSLDKP